MANVAKIPAAVLSALRNRDHSDDAIALMSPREAFTEYCMWNGLINWGDDLWDNMTALRDLGESPKVAIWMKDGFVRGAVAATPVEVSIIDHDIDDCGADPDEMISVPQIDGTPEAGYVTVLQAEVAPARMAELVSAINDPVSANKSALKR